MYIIQKCTYGEMLTSVNRELRLTKGVSKKLNSFCNSFFERMEAHLLVDGAKIQMDHFHAQNLLYTDY